MAHSTDEQPARGTPSPDLATISRQLEILERQQATIATFARAALSGLSLDELIELAVQLAASALDAPFAEVLRISSDRRVTTLVGGVGWSPDLVGDEGVPTAGIAFVLEADDPLVIDELVTESRFTPPPRLLKHGIVSGMATRLGSRRSPWGLIGVHTTKRRPFSKEDVNLLDALAHLLSGAINRRLDEARLRRRERRLQLVTDAMPALIGYCDRDLLYRFCNARYEEWFGRPRSEIVGRHNRELIGPEAFAEVEPVIERALQGERVSMEATFPYKGETHRPVLAHYIPDIGDDGTVHGYYLMIEDISERQETEAARSRLGSLVENIQDGLVGLECDGIITDWNRAAVEMFGYTAEEMIGGRLDRLVAPVRVKELETLMSNVVCEDTDVLCELEMFPKDGVTIFVSVAISPVHGYNDNVAGVSAIFRDITHQKQTEDRLRAQADQLEVSVRTRTADVQRQSDELRRLAIQLSDTEQHVRTRLARTLHDDLQQLLVATKLRVPTSPELATPEKLASVLELLDSAIDAARSMVLDLRPPVLNHGSIADILSWVAAKAKDQHEIDVEVQCVDPPHPPEERVRTLVYDAVRELLFNVAKHAKIGSARVEAVGSLESIAIRVSDDGCGFDPDDTPNADGTGFGLLSIRERVHSAGGTLTVTSAPGEGSTFLINIPLRAAGTSSAASSELDGVKRTESAPSSDVLRLLVVDDHAIVREGLVRLLNDHPELEVIAMASNGREAVTKTIQYNPDVVIMDLSMPGMNGIEATRRIRELVPSTIVIGLSLHDQREVGHRMTKAGAAAYLPKDGPTQNLIDAILTHSGRA